jgi:putative hydrolase of the HAD superfamily
MAAFERRFFSCYLRAVKPDPAAYHQVIEALGAVPEEIVFFDDREDNVMAAAALGIEAHMFMSPRQFDDLPAPSV